MSISRINIENVLRLCERYYIEMFLVSKAFKKILIKIIYTPKFSDKLFNIACYENDRIMIGMLIRKQLIKFDKQKEDSFICWNDNIFNKQFTIHWQKFYCYFNNLTDIVDACIPEYSENIPIEYSDFGYKLILHFRSIMKRFIRISLGLWKYKNYEIVYYDSDVIHRYIFLLDYKFNNFLIIGNNDGRPDFICNKFGYNNYNIIEYNLMFNEDLKSLFRNLIIFYKQNIAN